MYKDKDKQREANRQQMKRARAKGNTEQGNTSQGNTPCISDADREQIEKDMVAIGLKPVRTAQGNIRVSKPGDDDYVSESGSESGFDDETSPNHQDEGPSLSGSPGGKIETSSTVQE